MKNRSWIIIFAAVILVCSALFLFASNIFGNSSIVGVYQNGVLIEKIDLNSVSEKREIKISGENGENIILISHGSIKMLSADCPDKLCVNHGELKKGGTPIVCLPNKIVIKWENSSDEYDAKTGA